MSRSVLVDLFKVLASQLIVLHHLCVYTPMADWLAKVWPTLIKFIEEDGRLAVQPFLVIGGFLAAQALHKRRDYLVWDLVLQRYIRLAPQFACALLLVMASTVMVGKDLVHADWVSPLPTVSVLLAHLFFLQDVLGVPSLLAGAWYVAIDLQLFVLFVLLMYAVRRLPREVRDSVVPAVLAAATSTSILVFSREPSLDIWAIYFLSAYGLGALAAWSTHSPSAKWCWWAVVALLLVDCWVAPREQPQPLWALAAALALHAKWRWSWSSRTDLVGRVIRRLSSWSYGMFVCHFAVIILVSGLWERFHMSGLTAALLAFLLVMMTSLGLGAVVQASSARLIIWWNRGGALARSAD